MWTGNWFHSLGPHTAKLRSPKPVLVLFTASLEEPEYSRVNRMRSILYVRYISPVRSRLVSRILSILPGWNISEIVESFIIPAYDLTIFSEGASARSAHWMANKRSIEGCIGLLIFNNGGRKCHCNWNSAPSPYFSGTFNVSCHIDWDWFQPQLLQGNQSTDQVTTNHYHLLTCYIVTCYR